MIGKKISPILTELEYTIWEFEHMRGIKPEYTNEGFRAATKIFMSVLMDKMYELQNFPKFLKLSLISQFYHGILERKY